MNVRKPLFLGATMAAMLYACSPEIAEKTETENFNAWLEETFEISVARSPVFQTFLGRKTDYNRWDDETPEFSEESYLQNQAWAVEMQEHFDYDALDPGARLSWRLFLYDAEQDHASWPFRDHYYVFDQFRAPHTQIPAFLINQHQVDSLQDARDYIARIRDVKRVMGEHVANFERAYEKGIHPPRWSYTQMIETAGNVISGAPFSAEPPSPIMADVWKKVDALDLSAEETADLKRDAEAALRESLLPAYENLIAVFKRHLQTVDNTDGVWKLPDGDAFYAHLLRSYTTTQMSPQDVHALGLREVARIHVEMFEIQNEVNFTGSRQEFFHFMRTDPRFFYSNDDAGRADYLRDATQMIDRMRERLPALFQTFPKAELDVRRVEPFRELSVGKAFYQRPALNGSRPGIFYANLSNMGEMPNYQMEALAYHEGIPGHHMQIAIAQELQGVPSFRRVGGHTAYTEGWGLYSEYVPKEMGFYEDPYSNFGRLAMELWRAARLVVDTGIHHKRWSREEAIAYLVENTPNPEEDCVAAIERYIVYPGQATAYKVGMNEILRLRHKAETALKENFHVGRFHDAVLAQGSVPLSILAELIDHWIAEELTQI